MKGIYILLIGMSENQRIRVGRLGVLEFPKGLYAYVGSAQGGLEARIARHRSREKRRFWHIDYFLERGRILEVYARAAPKEQECRTARELERKFRPVPGFGCSDCGCKSHLFFLGR